jgi:hypothetical protein
MVRVATVRGHPNPIAPTTVLPVCEMNASLQGDAAVQPPGN